MDLRTLIVEYMEKTWMLQVATAKNNQPWVCTVHYAFDDELNLYWISKPSTRHSQEVQENEKVAGAIVLPHALGDKVRGLQIEGTATAVTDPDEIRTALNHYSRRFGMSEERVNAIVNGTDGHNCYKLSPSLLVLFDTLNFPDNPRQELFV